MGDYQDVIKQEAKKFFDSVYPEFQKDAEEFGGGSGSPNFARWLDRTERLNKVVEQLSAKWGMKELQWVRANTRNPIPSGGDPHSNAFGSFYSDLLHEIKRLKKKTPGE